MDNESIIIFKKIGIIFDQTENLDGLLIPREQLLNDEKYNEVKPYILNLKAHYSSSFLTCLQESAYKSQKWPLLNLVRQILNAHNYKMNPIRKADGYTIDGVKKYKRFFHITKKNNKNNTMEKIDTQLEYEN
jgi:hypothetical protein